MAQLVKVLATKPDLSLIHRIHTIEGWNSLLKAVLTSHKHTVVQEPTHITELASLLISTLWYRGPHTLLS